MKRIVPFIISIVMSTSISAQRLSERQLHLATCAALEAQGDLVRLEPAIRAALDAKVTVNELKEAFSQLYAYTGFPRSLNALNVLSNVLEDGNESWNEGKHWTRPSVWDDADASLKSGTKTQTKLSGNPFDYTFCPQTDFYLKSHLFGDIFAGDQLSPSDREIVTVAALSAIKGVSPQLASHKLGAVRMGNTQEQINELCKFLSDNGLSQCDAASDAVAGDWKQGNPNTNYAQYFTGNSYLNTIVPVNLTSVGESVLPLSNVTFEPGCRNNWHIHHGARQILICISGHGWYQEWNKPAIVLKTGDVVEIPEGVKHWHGAQKNSWFQQLSTHIKVENTCPRAEPNEWLEPVSDEEYDSLSVSRF